MKHSVCYLLIIVLPVIVYAKKLCNTASDICETVPDDFNVEALEKINNWWQGLPVKKPLKCSGKPIHEEDFIQGAEGEIFKTMPCLDSMAFGAQKSFSFKGEIVDHKLTGNLDRYH